MKIRLKTLGKAAADYRELNLRYNLRYGGRKETTSRSYKEKKGRKRKKKEKK